MAKAGQQDSWVAEFDEAMRLADDITGRISECNAILASKGDPSRVASAARRKVTMLGTKLDRLESLLDNPSLKTKLSEKELYRRKDMLLGLSYKMKQMNASLSTSQNTTRGSLLSEDAKGPPIETNRTSGLDNPGLVGLQRQIMREQDDELLGLEATVKSTKHIALTVNEELDLHTRLLDDLDQEADYTNSRLKMAQKRLALFSKRAGGGQSLLCMFIMLMAIVVLVLIVLRLVNVW
ncbi:hypothetical protein O6H91_20G049800 [Diphasiastrum complanatum]|uniref:Uncharacterized protein n=1 Tax=Diphasiastrum complanatum TaxID=34168 RepID=A0ACC2AQ75_DIPCM|nr:hypothetical protein O6H91_20G049800 [Diphasiastrum complanatum]